MIPSTTKKRFSSPKLIELHKSGYVSTTDYLITIKVYIDNTFRPIKWSSSGPSQRVTKSQKAAHTYGIPLVFTSGLIR